MLFIALILSPISMKKSLNPEFYDTGIERAGVIPWYNSKLVLIKSTGKGKHVFPKGKIESSETAQTAAMREAFEEAGIKGTIQKDIGVINGVRWFFVIVSSLEDNYKEMKTRDRKLMSVEEIFNDKNNVSNKAKEVIRYIKSNENIF